MTISAAASAAEDFPTEDYRKLAEGIAQQFFGRECDLRLASGPYAICFTSSAENGTGAYLSVPFLDQKRD
jgi:hypothetical protein